MKEKMKKSRLVIGVLILYVSIMLSSCGNTDANNTQDISENLQNTSENTQDTSENTQDTSENTEDIKSTENIIDSFVEQPLDLENYSLDYKLATDDQPFFYWHEATKSEYGYYYFRSKHLMFFDKASQKQVPLCNQADCTHDKSDCNADFSSHIEEEYTFSISRLQYYDGNIYMIGYDSEGYTSLFRIAADGSSREKYMELYKADMTSTEGENQTQWTAPEFCIHRGYVYFIDYKESIPKIRRIKMGTSEIEVVFEPGGLRPNVYRVQGYGDYIFFQTGNYVDDTYTKTKGGIYAYNIQTGEIQLLKADAIAAYVVEDHTLYYEYNGRTEFRSLNLITQEDKLVLDISIDYDLSVDEHYIYKFSGAGMLDVFDHEGNLVCTVNQAVQNCYFSDGTYIIGRDYNYDKHLSCIIEVSDFADGKAEWTYLD